MSRLCEAIQNYGSHDWLVFRCEDAGSIDYVIYSCAECGRMKKVKA